MNPLKMLGILLFIVALLGACAASPAPSSPPEQPTPFPAVAGVERLGSYRIVVYIEAMPDGGRVLEFAWFEDDSIGIVEEYDACTIWVDAACGAPAIDSAVRMEFECWAEMVVNGGRLSPFCTYPGYDQMDPAVRATAERLFMIAALIRSQPHPAYLNYKVYAPIVAVGR